MNKVLQKVKEAEVEVNFGINFRRQIGYCLYLPASIRYKPLIFIYIIYKLI